MNFSGKMFVIFICGNLYLWIARKTAKIRAHKNFVPHGIGPKKTKIIDTNISSKNTIWDLQTKTSKKGLMLI